jgi:peroxiredoxin Q/BCP
LSDPGKEVARAYGVFKMLGKFAARHTFYIGSDGKILFIDRDVKVGTAGADIAARLEQLGLPHRGER